MHAHNFDTMQNKQSQESSGVSPKERSFKLSPISGGFVKGDILAAPSKFWWYKER